jgi:hypothetical protein
VVRSRQSFLALFNTTNRRATILAAVPWFLQDLGTYGIGIFTPTILAASIGHKTAHIRSLADLIGNDELAARGAALIDVLLIVGIVCAIVLVDKIGSIRLQVFGFIGCAAGLAIAAASGFSTGGARMLLIFAGFMLFNFMTNLGPNSQTYLLAGEVFPRRLCGGVREDRRRRNRLLVPAAAGRYRNADAAFHPGRHVAGRRHRHLVVSNRDHRSEPGADRKLNGKTSAAGPNVTSSDSRPVCANTMVSTSGEEHAT